MASSAGVDIFWHEYMLGSIFLRDAFNAIITGIMFFIIIREGHYYNVLGLLLILTGSGGCRPMALRKGGGRMSWQGGSLPDYLSYLISAHLGSALCSIRTEPPIGELREWNPKDAISGAGILSK